MDAQTAKVEQELDAQEWNMQEIERKQRLQVILLSILSPVLIEMSFEQREEDCSCRSNARLLANDSIKLA